MPEKQNKNTFEQNIAELENIVELLESGDATLDNSLKMYEKGVALIRECHQVLNGAQRKLEILSGLDENGDEITQPMDDEILDNEQKIKSRSSRRGYKKTESEEDED